jgi:hypothetical protein
MCDDIDFSNWEENPRVRQMRANSIFGLPNAENDDKSYAEAINKIRELMYNYKPQVTECPDNIFNQANEMFRQMLEDREKTLAEIITKYNFMVGSAELKEQLTEILPKEANIVYSPFILNPTTIFAIKKFDIMDIISQSKEE